MKVPKQFTPEQLKTIQTLYHQNVIYKEIRQQLGNIGENRLTRALEELNLPRKRKLPPKPYSNQELIGQRFTHCIITSFEYDEKYNHWFVS